MNDIHGKLPEDWKLKTIDDLSVRVGSGVTPRGGSEVYTHEGVLFIRSQNVRFNGLDLGDVAYIDQKTHDSMQASEIFPQDVLFNITGASIGRCCIVPDGIGSANVNQHVCAIRLSDPTTSDARYLSIVLSSSIGQDQVLRFNAGGNREGLNYQQLRSFQIPWPPRAQRKVIAEILSTVDRAIEQTEAAIAKQQRIKTGLMQDLLTRGIDEHGNLRSEQTHHFKDSPLGRIPVEWNARPLSDIVGLKVGYAFKSSWFSESGIRLLRGENVGTGKPDWKDTRWLPFHIAVKYPEYELDAGALIIGMDRTFTKQGFKVSLIKESDTPCLLVQRVGCFIPLNIPEGFMQMLIQSDMFQRELLLQQKGMDIPHLSKCEILSPIVPVPGRFDEMHEISTKFKMLIASETDTTDSLEKLYSLKAALMQDLLTGRKRVTMLLNT